MSKFALVSLTTGLHCLTCPLAFQTVSSELPVRSLQAISTSAAVEASLDEPPQPVFVPPLVR